MLTIEEALGKKKKKVYYSNNHVEPMFPSCFRGDF